MRVLINLIGQQPIPNLLLPLFIKPDKNILLYTDTTEMVAARVNKLLNNSVKVKIEPYEFAKALEDIKSLTNNASEFLFNLTGGTKIMALAAYQVAKDNRSKFVYLQSEGRKSILYSYSAESDNYTNPSKEFIPGLIDIDMYLKAHLPDYDVTGYSTMRDSDKLTIGGEFEKAIYEAIDKNKFEILFGIKPKGVGEQIEIDMAIRLKGTNNVGIAEIKLADKGNERPKKGIDQLTTAAEQEYLGTYTTRFLIMQKPLNYSLKKLAREHNINVIDNLSYNFAAKKIEPKSINYLNNKLFEKLS